MTPLEDVALHHISGAMRVSLKRLVEKSQEDAIDDPADYWVDLVASALNGMPLLWPPMVDSGQSPLPFEAPHRIETEVYLVGSSGLLGGPTLDVLLQVWFETESMNAAFGIPLLMRRVPSFGPVPRAIWDERRETALRLNEITPCGRLLLLGHPDPFGAKPHHVISEAPLYVLSTILAAGMTDPPRGLSGVILEHFAYDFASGWIGDPVLSGGRKSPELNAFLSYFDTARILRIRIRKVTTWT